MMDSERLKSGLTWRSLMGIIYAIVVLQPAAIFVFLLTGYALVAASVQWLTLILLIELTRLTGKPLSRQEAAVIFSGSLLAGTYGIFIGWIYNAYYKNSEAAAIFGLMKEIPPFYAPESAEPWTMRTFFHPSWTPVVLTSITFILCATLAQISLGLLGRRLYIEIEDLPFPLQIPSAEATLTLIDREPKRLRILAVMTAISLVYGFVAYGLPLIFQAFNIPISTIPVPWIDFNYYIHRILPGASFGIATSISPLAIGMILPFQVVLAILVGSIAIYVVGNAILVIFGLTKFAAEWSPGMNIQYSLFRSTLYAWNAILIGVAIAVALFPLLRKPEVLTIAFKGFLGRQPKKAPPGIHLPYRLLVVGFIVGTLGVTILSAYLVPEFPIWIFLLLNLGVPSLFYFAIIRIVGVTGLSIGIPYLRELMLIGSGYKKYDVWFTPTFTLVDWTSGFKYLDLCDVEPISFIKAWLITWPIAWFFGFLYVSQFWSIAPMPSAAYPGINWAWPFQALGQSIWITRPVGIFNIPNIVGGFAGWAVLYLICDFIFHAPAFALGMAGGFAQPIPFCVTTFIGGLIGVIIQKKLGKDFWGSYKPTVSAGLILGESIAIILGLSVNLISKSMWVLPY